MGEVGVTMCPKPCPLGLEHVFPRLCYMGRWGFHREGVTNCKVHSSFDPNPEDIGEVPGAICPAICPTQHLGSFMATCSYDLAWKKKMCLLGTFAQVSVQICLGVFSFAWNRSKRSKRSIGQTYHYYGPFEGPGRWTAAMIAVACKPIQTYGCASVHIRSITFYPRLCFLQHKSSTNHCVLVQRPVPCS